MGRRRSFAILLSAAAITCGSLTLTGPATAKDKGSTASAAPAHCDDLMNGFAEVKGNVADVGITSLSGDGTGVWLDEHEHDYTLDWQADVVVDAHSTLANDGCGAATYLLNLYSLADPTTGARESYGSFTGVAQGTAVGFLTRQTFEGGVECLGVELVALRDGLVVDAVPDREPEPTGEPQPYNVCLEPPSGAGSMSG